MVPSPETSGSSIIGTTPSYKGFFEDLGLLHVHQGQTSPTRISLDLLKFLRSRSMNSSCEIAFEIPDTSSQCEHVVGTFSPHAVCRILYVFQLLNLETQDHEFSLFLCVTLRPLTLFVSRSKRTRFAPVEVFLLLEVFQALAGVSIGFGVSP